MPSLNMKKLNDLKKEKMLYSTWLDLHYSFALNMDILSDLEDQLKDTRKHLYKTRRLLLKASNLYLEVYGDTPQAK